MSIHPEEQNILKYLQIVRPFTNSLLQFFTQEACRSRRYLSMACSAGEEGVPLSKDLTGVPSSLPTPRLGPAQGYSPYPQERTWDMGSVSRGTPVLPFPPSYPSPTLPRKRTWNQTPEASEQSTIPILPSWTDKQSENITFPPLSFVHGR